MPSAVRHSTYRMNSPQGKAILALIRDGDFAHPGEVEAVDLVFQDLSEDPGRRVLDLGCGRGGTAARIHELRKGNVTGVDVDAQSITYCKETYPEQNFIATDAHTLHEVLTSSFDVICMFNSLYTMRDQLQVLREVRKVAAGGAQLLVFDYLVSGADPRAQDFARAYEGSLWKPLERETYKDLFEQAGWRVNTSKDITAKYAQWYGWLGNRIKEKKDAIIEISNQAWYAHVLGKYSGYAVAAEEGVVGGVILKVETH